MSANKNKRQFVVGIDEVGRGALAGPVVLAAVACRRPMRWTHSKFGRIRDCKKLTAKRREAWFSHLTAHPRFTWCVARVSPPVIDRINISRAADRGALRAYLRLVSTNNESTTNIRIRRFATDSIFVDERPLALLDGGLSLPPHIPQRTMVKGDERIPLIAAASIMAKVWRDRHMCRLGRSFPTYGFHLHKGYGTRLHRRMIRRHGRSAIHRRTFLA